MALLVNLEFKSTGLTVDEISLPNGRVNFPAGSYRLGYNGNKERLLIYSFTLEKLFESIQFDETDQSTANGGPYADAEEYFNAVANAAQVSVADFYMNVARGVGLENSDRKHGLLPILDSADGAVEIWNDPTKANKTFPVANAQYDVIATAGDVGKTVRLVALKDDGAGKWDEVHYDVILINGTVTTPPAEVGLRLNRAFVILGSDNAGVITINITGGALQGRIDIGQGTTQMSHYTAPSSTIKKGLSSGVRQKRISASIMRASGGAGAKRGEATIYSREFGSAKTLLFIFGLSTDGASFAPLVQTMPPLIPPKTDIWITGNADSNGTRFFTDIEYLIEPA